MFFYRVNEKCQVKKNAFTLIELLVVIAIIALLLSILLPALKRVKEAGKRTHCLANVKSLAVGMMLYTNDYDSKFPKARTDTNGWIQRVVDHWYDPWRADKELQLDAIREGLLYPYIESTDVYRCPVAQKNEFRTYSMTHALNGFPDVAIFYGGEVLIKINQVKNTAGRILFLDDYIFDWDACWMVFNDRHSWWNSVPIRHGSGGNVFSFVDGHSEFHDWKDSRTVELGERCFEANTPETSYFPTLQHPTPNNEDLIWTQRATWGTVAYTP